MADIIVDRSNLVTQILLEGAHEILGADILRSALGELTPGDLISRNDLSLPGPLPLGEAGALLQILEGIYGVPGGRGLALRIGRSAFKYGLNLISDQTDFRTSEFRLLPAPQRIENGLHALAHIIAVECSEEISVTDAGTHWLWRSTRCPLCRDHFSVDPCCYLMVGFLQEFTTWASGRFYQVRETECRAMGSPACIYRIDKKPLD